MKNYRLFILLSALFPVLHTVQPANADAFNGFYVGGKVGHEFSYVETNSGHWSGNGIKPGIFAGYGKTFDNRFYLGGELDWTLSGAEHNLKSNIKGIDLNIDLRTLSVFTIGGRIGYVKDNTMLYGRLGYSRIQRNLFATFAPIPGNVDDDISSDGVTFGLGMTTMLTPVLSLRIECVWIYDTIDYYENAALNLDGASALSPFIGLAYHF